MGYGAGGDARGKGPGMIETQHGWGNGAGNYTAASDGAILLYY